MHKPLSDKIVTGSQGKKFFVTASQLLRGEDHGMRKERGQGRTKQVQISQGKVSG